MQTLRVHEILTDKILISREAARLLEDPLRSITAEDSTVESSTSESVSNKPAVAVDFAGVDGMAPSFLDELLRVFESIVGAATDGDGVSLTVVHPPARLSSKFEAVARGHRMSVEPLPDGSWRLSRQASG
jgi:hypothetical protein